MDKAARDIIKSAGYGENFTHSLGHSLGLEIHEEPHIPKYEDEGEKKEKEKTKLALNMAMTVEPGIYLEGEFGVRIEDLIIAKKDGCLNLTKSPKQLIEI